MFVVVVGSVGCAVLYFGWVGCGLVGRRGVGVVGVVC